MADSHFSTHAAGRVREIGQELHDLESHILYTSPLQLSTRLFDAQTEALVRGMVWLSWADCHSLLEIFRHFEYVDSRGQPTSLVDGYASRLTGGERKAPETGTGKWWWRWGGSSENDDGDEEGAVRRAAWDLVSSVFARATALQITAEAEEVSESDAQAVLTWFPRLEYLDIQGIPRNALLFWETWLPERASCLVVRYAGVDLVNLLDISAEAKQKWQHLVLLDLSGSPGINLAPFKELLAPQLPQLERLSLASCELTQIPGTLAKLYKLSWLDLHGNAIDNTSDISLRLGNIRRLNLSANRLSSLAGMQRLWALEQLDISDNLIENWEAVAVMRNLPSLRALSVAGNPFATQDSSYRARIFAAFDHRDIGLLLDDAPAQPPVTKGRRPKVALIEESPEGDAEPDSGNQELVTEPPVDEILRSLEKTPRVLRASELQAATVSSSRRRSHVTESLLNSPRKQRRRTTLGNGLPANNISDIGGFGQSVPARYSQRPTSPVPSVSGASVRTGSIMRDPERYRRRVEMMRAEAGSSWLRAFAELQASSSVVPQSPILEEDQQSSESADALSKASVEASPEVGVDIEVAERSATASPDTQLPSFLFPRKRGAKKKDIARLPHYTDQKRPEEAEVLSPEDEMEAYSESASSREVPVEEEAVSEIQMLLRGEGVRTAISSVSVSDYRIAPVAESAPAELTDAAGSSIVQRSPAVVCTLYFTQDDVVEVAGMHGTGLPDAVSGESADSKRIISKNPLSGFGTPVWTDYCVESTDDDAKLFMQLSAAADANNEAGLSENVFKQAECLRCNWRGYIDSEREIFDMLQSEMTVVKPTGELQCPSCKRSYLREFYAADEQNLDEPILCQPFMARRNRSNSASKQAEQERHAEKARRARHDEHRRQALEALALDLQILGDAATDGFLPFAKVTNAISLFLQLSVFEADGERLMQWVPAGLVRQIRPLVPTASATNRRQSSGTSKQGTGKWGLSSLLGTAQTADEGKAEEEAFAAVENKRAFIIERGWKASAMLAPELSEQAVYLALSSHAVYVFSPTWHALQDVPSSTWVLLFSIPLTSLGRIDIGPNRQYLALHSSLLSLDKSGEQWSRRELSQLLSTTHPAYPTLGYSQLLPSEAKDSVAAMKCKVAAHQQRFSLFVDGLRLFILVEIGYETRALDSRAGEGSGRLRGINHDVEWAMHHLVQQVFLRPSTFDPLDEAPLVGGDEGRELHSELLHTKSGRVPGAIVDSASGDNVIVDKVTYEFLKLYFCVGLASPTGIAPVSLVGSPQFLYLVRERVDVWPPPAPDLRALYRKWQRVAPPTIALEEELRQRSNAPSSASSKPTSARSGTEEQEDEETEEEIDNSKLVAQLMSTEVNQYDRVQHARPIVDLRRVALLSRPIAVLPKLQAPPQASSENLVQLDTFGCTGTSWRAMLRIEFATAEGAEPGWNVWFGTRASAQECVESLQVLAKSSDHVHPLIGGEAKARLVARLHELGTTQAYRMLGSILKRDPDDVPQDEFWAHTRQGVASGQSVWESDVDFIVALTTFPGLGSSVMTEVRVAINSCEEASGETIAALTVFFNDFRVLSPEPVFVMGIDEYLYRGLPLTCEDESICDGYSMGIEEWRRAEPPGPLSQMTADDLEVVEESSKIKYPREYLEYLLPCSQIVAWGMAHRDYQLGLIAYYLHSVTASSIRSWNGCGSPTVHSR
ncbi:hypothetical protein DL89DRAFT_291338 [Linderina pennispora]|uniref:L domain-like protein n=1 Tax=Linderina pennispora TaxID=61395 RepID=A0A1Y1WF25_9FUNG|nr:uncharacterized protein DL89DRAFT_291338 [Linderina pennispora]ORX72103.1 hypothetical protein DL89DRAFT_291338 [Linderina pennispora]